MSIELTSFRFPTNIRYGAGSRRALSELAADYGVGRPLLVTDEALTRTESYRQVAQVCDAVWTDGWHAFSGVHPNPLENDVEEAWKVYDRRHCDGVIGLGGGSALDAGKALRVKVTQPDLPVTRISLERLPQRLVPYFAIPTTAGTGSEVGRSSVLTVPELGRKVLLGASPMMPDVAILNPELTVGLPPHLTAATGMDAMTHAIESYVCPVFHPMCDAIALEAIRLVRLYLPRAVIHGGDLEARGMMLLAASMGAVAFQKDLGAAHSLAHPLSTEFGVHHGLANAVVLPHVVRFNGRVDSRLYERVASALGLADSADPANAVADWLAGFNQQLGLPAQLRDVGVPADSLPRLADKAFEDACHLTNPRACSRDDLLALYRQAW